MTGIAADVRSLDPGAYAAAVGLAPDDCYGFLPIDHDDVTPYLYLYRDRAEYAQARASLPAPQRVKKYGPVRVEPTQQIEIDASSDPKAAQGDFSDVAAAAQKMAEAYGPPVVAHRIYPGLRTRSSGRQLNYYLPRYRDAVGLRSDDTYGVLPRRTRSTVETSSTEWDDYWIVYRDRPEYAAGREEWAREMNKKGNWPEPMVYPGIAEAPGLTHDPGGAGGKLRIEKQGWPRKALFKRETGDELGASVRDRLQKWEYEPEDSFGLSPNYTNRSIYFAWRRD
jgi:hypothetical protein